MKRNSDFQIRLVIRFICSLYNIAIICIKDPKGIRSESLELFIYLTWKKVFVSVITFKIF